MSTTFNFPANPAIGDQFTLPNGTISQWNGSEWVSVGDATMTVTYPLPITLGGTGANAAGPARVNLGLNTATGEFIVQKDGTAAAPGIAFASEPGLGWYRKSAGMLGMAASGAECVAFNLGTPASVGIGITPRAAGEAYVSMTNAVSGAANFNYTVLKQYADGHAALETQKVGTATRGNLTLDAPQVNTTGGMAVQGVTLNLGTGTSGQTFIINGSPTGGKDLNGLSNGVARWLLRLGNGAPDDNFQIWRNNDSGTIVGQAMQIIRATGQAQFEVAIVNGPSDRSLKENIAPIDNALAKVLALQGVSFNMIGNEQREIGFIANDVEPIVPEVIQPFGEGKLAMDYPKLTAILVESIKTLHQRLKAIGA